MNTRIILFLPLLLAFLARLSWASASMAADIPAEVNKPQTKSLPTMPSPTQDKEALLKVDAATTDATESIPQQVSPQISKSSMDMNKKEAFPQKMKTGNTLDPPYDDKQTPSPTMASEPYEEDKSAKEFYAESTKSSTTLEDEVKPKKVQPSSFEAAQHSPSSFIWENLGQPNSIIFLERLFTFDMKNLVENEEEQSVQSEMGGKHSFHDTASKLSPDVDGKFLEFWKEAAYKYNDLGSDRKHAIEEVVVQAWKHIAPMTTENTDYLWNISRRTSLARELTPDLETNRKALNVYLKALLDLSRKEAEKDQKMYFYSKAAKMCEFGLLHYKAEEATAAAPLMERNKVEEEEEKEMAEEESYLWNRMSHPRMPELLDMFFHFNAQVMEVQLEEGKYFGRTAKKSKLDKQLLELWNKMYTGFSKNTQALEAVKIHVAKVWDDAMKDVKGKSYAKDSKAMLSAASGNEKLLKKLFVNYFQSLKLDVKNSELLASCEELRAYVTNTFAPLLEEAADEKVEEKNATTNEKAPSLTASAHGEDGKGEQEASKATTADEKPNKAKKQKRSASKTNSPSKRQKKEEAPQVLEFSIKTPDVTFLQIIEERYLVFDVEGDENLVIIDTNDYFDAVPFDESPASVSQSASSEPSPTTKNKPKLESAVMFNSKSDDKSAKGSKLEMKSDAPTSKRAIPSLTGLEMVIAERHTAEVSTESNLDDTIVNVKDPKGFVNTPMIFAIGSATLAMLVFLALTIRFTLKDTPDHAIPELATQ